MTTGENEDDRSHTDPIEWSMYFKGFVTVLQYVWGQYAMHNLGANSARPPVEKFTNFMVGRNPLVIERLLPHSKSQVASSQGASFFSLKILLDYY